MVEAKKWLVVIVTAFICVFLVWFGFRLAIHSRDMSELALFLLGCLAMLGGVLLISASGGQLWRFSILVFVVAAYYFARSGGVIAMPWLAWVFGFASIVAAVMVSYAGLQYAQRTTDQGQDSDLNLVM